MNYICHFIAKFTTTYQPLFKLLTKNKPMVWNNNCEMAFEKIKAYLLNPSILVPPLPGRPLLMYLEIHEASMSCVPGQVKSNRQLLPGQEIRRLWVPLFYPEKLLLCLDVGNAGTTPLYAVPHHIYLPNWSTKVLIWKLVLSGRLAWWQSSVGWTWYHLCHIGIGKGANHFAGIRVDGYQPLLVFFPINLFWTLKQKRNTLQYVLWWSSRRPRGTES